MQHSAHAAFSFNKNKSYLNSNAFLICCKVLLSVRSATQESHPVSNRQAGISSAEGEWDLLCGDGGDQIPSQTLQGQGQTITLPCMGM